MKNVPHSHPSREELGAFGAGKLNVVQSDEIEQHLHQCDACRQLLNTIPDDDTLVSALRGAGTETSFSPEQSGTAATIAPSDDQRTPQPRLDLTEFASADRPAALATLPAELRDHPRYRILELLGRGGMGDVYRAEHKLMNRPVALKVIKPELVQNDAAVRRFRREVQAAARLNHPNIVTAHDAEQAGDVHYLVMEFVDGVDLDEVIRRRGSLSVEEACGYIRQAAAGLQHAHELGMVHRDVKPHNLMAVGIPNVESEQAQPATIKILDFGLASFASESAFGPDLETEGEPAPAVDARPQLTQMGAMMGTPDYIAPEQAEDAHQADIRADVYSLGCTFYTLLAGRPPFGEGAVLEKIMAHMEQEPPPLSEFRDDVPAEVEAVVQKMMAKDPAERFQTPGAVADALARFIDERIDEKLRERGVGAGPPGITKPVGLDESGADKHVLSAAIFLMAVGVLNVAHTVLVSYRLAPWPEWMELPGLGSSFGLLWGLVMMFGAWRMSNRQSYRWSVVTAITAMTPLTPVNLIFGLPFGLWALLLLLRPESKDVFGRVEPAPKSPRNVAGGAPHEKARWTFAAAMIGFAVLGFGVLATNVWRPNQPRAPGMAPGAPSGSSPTPPPLTNQQRTTDVAPAAPSEVLRGHTHWVWTAAVSPEGQRLASAGHDGLIKLWNPHTREELRTCKGHAGPVFSAAFSPDGQWLASAGGDRTVRLWNVETGRLKHTFQGHDGAVRSVACSPDGKWVASAGQDTTVRLWDVEARTAGPVLAGHDGAAWCIAFSPNGESLASASHDNTVRLWSVASGELIAELTGHTAPVDCVAFSPDGSRLASAGRDLAIRLWSADSAELEGLLVGHNQRVYSVAFSPDGDTLASGSWDHTVKLWNVPTRTLSDTLRGHTEHVKSVAFLPDGEVLASSSGDRTVRLWRLPESVLP